jgi:hypothetical protein
VEQPDDDRVADHAGGHAAPGDLANGVEGAVLIIPERDPAIAAKDLRDHAHPAGDVCPALDRAAKPGYDGASLQEGSRG